MYLILYRLGKAGQRRVLKEADLCQHEEKSARTNTVILKSCSETLKISVWYNINILVLLFRCDLPLDMH